MGLIQSIIRLGRGLVDAVLEARRARNIPTLTEEDLADYDELTFFNKQEIAKCYYRFASLAPDILRIDRLARIPQEAVLNMPQISVNPFSDRILKLFSSEEDGSMSFEDFLDMMSVFSDRAPPSIKAEYAFRIYDFDGDDMISVRDVKELIKRLIHYENYRLTSYEVDELATIILNESDMDEDRLLAYAEFEHAMKKAPDFLTTFHMKV